MTKRPIPILVVGWFFIVAGVVGIVYHAREFNIRKPSDPELLIALAVRVLAVVGGVFVLRGAKAGRLVLILWLVYHAILSAFHPLTEFLFHVVLLAIVGFVLFRPEASAWFQRTATISGGPTNGMERK